MHKIGGARFQCVNNHCPKFDYKGMNTVGVTDYTTLAPPKHFRWKKMSKFNTPQKREKLLKHAQNTCTSAHL